jgi:AcrR family transcriptional regulator
MTTLPAARRPGRPRDGAIDVAVLDAAIEELIERGYLGMSVESIAARAGVAKTTVYRRWPGQDELVVAAIRMLEDTTAVPPAGSARDELLYLVDRMRRTWSNPRYGALMRRVAADGTERPEQYRQFRDKLVSPHLERMHRALSRCVDDGLIRPGTDLVWVRQLITSPILASVLTHKDRVTRLEVEFALDTVLAGLAP